MGLRDIFQRKKRDEATKEFGNKSPDHAPGISASDFPAQEFGSPAEVVQKEYAGHNPESAADGMSAVSDAVEHGTFMVPAPEKNAENPFFWKGVAAALQTEGLYGNSEAAQLAVEINGMVNQAQNRDGVQTDSAQVDFSRLDERVSEVLKNSDTQGLQKVA